MDPRIFSKDDSSVFKAIAGDSEPEDLDQIDIEKEEHLLNNRINDNFKKNGHK